MQRSLKSLEAERERVVLYHEMALEMSNTPLKVALSCSRQTTLVERAIERRLESLRDEFSRFVHEAAELFVAGVSSHEVVWRSSLGAAAHQLGASGSESAVSKTTCNCLELAFADVGIDKSVSNAALSVAEEEARLILGGGCLNWSEQLAFYKGWR